MVYHVGIIGAGPAGLTAALALEGVAAGERLRVTLLDRNRSPADHPGVEYGIQARATRALARLGLKDAALAMGHPAERMLFHIARGARDQLSVRVNPRETFNVRRGDFLERLASLLLRVEVLRGHDVARIMPLPGRRLRLHFAATGDAAVPAPMEFDVVIAADGVHSVARRTFFSAARSFDRGFSAVYLLCDGRRGDPRVPEAFKRLASGGTVQFTLGSFSTTAFFPHGDGRMVLALAVDHPTAWGLWRAHGLDPDMEWHEVPAPARKALAQAIARDTPIHGGFMERALELVEDWDGPRVYRWMMRDSDVLDRPFAPDCNLVLLGDAVHAFLPTIGMGASLAIEDAEHLGSSLGAFLLASAGRPVAELDLHAAVFAPHAAARRATWHDLMWRARAAAANLTGQGRLKRMRVAPYLPGRLWPGLLGPLERAAERLGI
jgi:2-polyprenyl-6-methoxyphenol hydroxylase-like FAD-dependent oxidoreductase